MSQQLQRDADGPDLVGGERRRRHLRGAASEPIGNQRTLVVGKHGEDELKQPRRFPGIKVFFNGPLYVLENSFPSKKQLSFGVFWWDPQKGS